MAAPASAKSKSGPWQVQLTKKQAKALAEVQRKVTPNAFAVSPDGAWGRAWGQSSRDEALAVAMHFCRRALKPGKRDCIAYAVNGEVVAPAVVDAKVVTKVYKPVDGRKAAAFFGLSGVNFAGNRPAALAQLEQVQAGNTALRSDPILSAALSRSSFTLAGAKGFALKLGKDTVEQHVQTNRAVLVISFTGWTATKEGLVCLFDGKWTSTGKLVGTKCLVLDHIVNGKARFSWESSLGTVRNGQLVAGDATRSAAR